MPAQRTVSTDDMLECVRAWAASRYPGRLPKRLRIYFHGDDPEDFIALSIPHGPLACDELDEPEEESSPAEGVAGAGNRELRDLIRQALANAPAAMKVSAIARKIGREYTSHFRSIIRLMREDGEIHQTPDKMYTLPPDE